MVIVLLGGKLAGRCGVPIRVDDAVCKLMVGTQRG